MITFLAIDPGTHQMGVALFEGTKLVNYYLLEAKGAIGKALLCVIAP